MPSRTASRTTSALKLGGDHQLAAGRMNLPHLSAV